MQCHLMCVSCENICSVRVTAFARHHHGLCAITVTGYKFRIALVNDYLVLISDCWTFPVKYHKWINPDLHKKDKKRNKKHFLYAISNILNILFLFTVMHIAKVQSFSISVHRYTILMWNLCWIIAMVVTCDVVIAKVAFFQCQILVSIIAGQTTVLQHQNQ